MRKEATLSYAIAYIIVFIMIIFVFVVGIPFMLQINTTFHQTGEDMLDLGLVYANKITNVSVKTSMVNILTANKGAMTNSETMLGKFAQFGWVFVIIVVSLVIVVLARRAELIN
jgi:t-SNARE complex subunit (syntaxin)